MVLITQKWICVSIELLLSFLGYWHVQVIYELLVYYLHLGHLIKDKHKHIKGIMSILLPYSPPSVL